MSVQARWTNSNASQSRIPLLRPDQEDDSSLVVISPGERGHETVPAVNARASAGGRHPGKKISGTSPKSAMSLMRWFNEARQRPCLFAVHVLVGLGLLAFIVVQSISVRQSYSSPDLRSETRRGHLPFPSILLGPTGLGPGASDVRLISGRSWQTGTSPSTGRPCNATQASAYNMSVQQFDDNLCYVYNSPFVCETAGPSAELGIRLDAAKASSRAMPLIQVIYGYASTPQELWDLANSGASQLSVTRQFEADFSTTVEAKYSEFKPLGEDVKRFIDISVSQQVALPGTHANATHFIYVQKLQILGEYYTYTEEYVAKDVWYLLVSIGGALSLARTVTLVAAFIASRFNDTKSSTFRRALPQQQIQDQAPQRRISV